MSVSSPNTEFDDLPNDELMRLRAEISILRQERHDLLEECGDLWDFVIAFDKLEMEHPLQSHAKDLLLEYENVLTEDDAE